MSAARTADVVAAAARQTAVISARERRWNWKWQELGQLGWRQTRSIEGDRLHQCRAALTLAGGRIDEGLHDVDNVRQDALELRVGVCKILTSCYHA